VRALPTLFSPLLVLEEEHTHRRMATLHKNEPTNRVKSQRGGGWGALAIWHQQDWILKCLRVGEPILSRPCGVTTLCCSPPLDPQ
jgi:hypothetical protein